MMFIPWKLIAVLVSWIVVATFVYEHEQEEFTKERAVAQAALDAANKHAKEVSDERESTVADISSRLEASQKAAQRAANDLNRHLASGASVMRFSGSCGGSMPNNPTVTGNDNKGTCNISPDIAESLVNLASRADETANKLNSCIDSYNALLEAK